MNGLIYNTLINNKTRLCSLVLILVVHVLYSQSFEEKISIPWNTADGISTELSSSSNRGLLDFEMINENTVALLCEVDKKVKVYNIDTDELIHEFSYEHDALCLSYDNEANIFYIGDYGQVHAYCEEGTYKNSVKYDDQKITCFNIEAKEKNLSILASGQETYQLINGSTILDKDQQQNSKVKGWLLPDGTLSEYTGRIVNGTITVKLTENGAANTYHIKTGVNSEGMHLLGRINDLLVLKEYYYKGDDRSNIFKYLIFYSPAQNKIITRQEIPRIRFTSQKDDIKIFNNKIYQLFTTPDNAILYEYNLSQLKSTSSPDINYPPDLNYDYHYNFHLKKETEYQLKSTGTTTDVGMRTEVLSRAYKYANLRWKATTNNLPFGLVSNINTEVNISTAADYVGVRPYHVKVPPHISITGINHGMVYKWHGWTHYNTWNYHLGQGKIVGDKTSYLKPYSEANDNNVIGIDCSGFISRAWDLGYKQNTTSLADPANELQYWSDLEPGDILNKAGSHVRMIVDYNSSSDIKVMEASAGHGRVLEHTLDRDDFVDYRAFAMPRIDSEYDLVYSDMDFPHPVNGNIYGSVQIRNIGRANFSGWIRIAIYREPAKDDPAEVGELVIRTAKTFNINTNGSVTFDFDEDLGDDLPAGFYIIRFEYDRLKGSDFQYQQIPYEDYQVNLEPKIVVNGLLLKGRVFNDDGEVPSAFTNYVVSPKVMLKSTSFTSIEGTTDAQGYFTEILPNGFGSAIISFPNSDHNDVTYDEGDGELAIYPERHEFSNNSEFYFSSISDGIRINGCADDVVFLRKGVNINITPLSRPAFALIGEYNSCGGGWWNNWDPCGYECQRSGLDGFIDVAIWVGTVGFADNDFELRGDCITIVEECTADGVKVSGGERYYVRHDQNCYCDGACYEDVVGTRVNTSGLKSNTYYKVTLADDDYGWTESSRLVYIVPEEAQTRTIKFRSANTLYMATESIYIKSYSILKTGFQAVIDKDYYPGCTTGSKSLNSKSDKANCEDCGSMKYAGTCQNIYLDNALIDNEQEFENEQIDDETPSKIFVFPSVTNSIVNVIYTGDIDEVALIEVHNNLGQVIENRVPESNKEEFDLSLHAPGMYFVRIIRNQDNNQVFKVIYR